MNRRVLPPGMGIFLPRVALSLHVQAPVNQQPPGGLRISTPCGAGISQGELCFRPRVVGDVDE